MSLQIFCVVTPLTPSVAVFGDRTLSRSLWLNEVIGTELLSRRTDVLKRRGRHALCLSLQLVAHRKGHMRTQGEGDCLQARKV